jgi:hypothetical protein
LNSFGTHKDCNANAIFPSPRTRASLGRKMRCTSW